ncbi:hypothetical protein OV320_7847 [Actinobacteria bacterium OV320]|jgi:hypothetical protein|nr:hypothetical protein OV320_7847 [Actinobacteria bacterium OV320]
MAVTIVKGRDEIAPRKTDNQESYDAYHARVMARRAARSNDKLRNQFRYAAGLISCPNAYTEGTCDAVHGGHH